MCLVGRKSFGSVDRERQSMEGGVRERNGEEGQKDGGRGGMKE